MRLQRHRCRQSIVSAFLSSAEFHFSVGRCLHCTSSHSPLALAAIPVADEQPRVMTTREDGICQRSCCTTSCHLLSRQVIQPLLLQTPLSDFRPPKRWLPRDECSNTSRWGRRWRGCRRQARYSPPPRLNIALIQNIHQSILSIRLSCAPGSERAGLSYASRLHEALISNRIELCWSR